MQELIDNVNEILNGDRVATVARSDERINALVKIIHRVLVRLHLAREGIVVELGDDTITFRRVANFSA